MLGDCVTYKLKGLDNATCAILGDSVTNKLIYNRRHNITVEKVEVSPAPLNVGLQDWIRK